MQMRRKRNTSGIYREHASPSIYKTTGIEREKEETVERSTGFLYGRRRLEETRERMKRKNWWNVVGECAVCFFFFFTPPPPPYSSSSSSTAIVGNIWMNLKLAGVVLVTCSRFQQPTTPSSSSQQSSRRRRPVGLILHRVNRRSSSAPMTLRHPYAGCAFLLMTVHQWHIVPQRTRLYPSNYIYLFQRPEIDWL